jgi:hypothetical protein
VWSAQRILSAVNLGFLDQGPLLLRSSSSSIISQEAEWTPFRPSTSQKIWFVKTLERQELALSPLHDVALPRSHHEDMQAL